MTKALDKADVEGTRTVNENPNNAKAPASKAKAQRAASTVTTIEIAAEQGISAKTLRARIRRNIDTWKPLFKDGEKHVFADNKTTRNKITALLS